MAAKKKGGAAARGTKSRRKTARKKTARKKTVRKKTARKKAAGTSRKSTRKTAKRGRPARKKATAGKKRAGRQAAAKQVTGKLYTLTEIGRMASISMPTLQKYKRNYQDRIPSVGEGRKQRYPREAVAVLKQIKQENLSKRGRPAGGGRKRATTSKGGEKLLTLTEIGRITGISYPTLSRYVKLFLDRIPHVGTGRKRRYPEEAVAIFRQIRSESRPGRPPSKKRGGGRKQSRGSRSERELMTRIRNLEKSVADLVKALKKPLQVTIKGR